MESPLNRQPWILLLIGAFSLRLPRAVLRWTEDAWSYLAYDGEMALAFEKGEYLTGLTDITGLHPPAWHLFHNAIEALFPVPMLLLFSSVLCSLGAVVIASRLGAIPALLLATSPLQVAYAAELNNIPAMALCAAWIWWARERTLANGGWSFAIAVAIGAWVHFLLAAMGLCMALFLGRTQRIRCGILLGFALLPLAPSLHEVFFESGAARQPPFKLNLILSDALSRFGWLGLVLLVPAFKGAKKRPDVAKSLLACWVLILLLQFARVAAPHQFPYYLALGLPFALLVQAGTRGPGMRLLIGLTVSLQAISLARSNMSQVNAINVDLGIRRGIDVALAEARPGDGIYLLRKRSRPDDDKRGFSAQLARISPWKTLPRVRPYPFPYQDHRHGQPRALKDLTIYVNDRPREVILDAASAHPRLFVVVSDHKGDPRYEGRLTALLGVRPESVGTDSLYRLSRE